MKVGKNFGILLTDQGTACTWGDNRVGQLGRLCRDNDAPSPIDLNEEVIQIACGNSHALVLTSEREVFAFGRNKSGQLGTGDTRDKTKPFRVPLPSDIQLIGCGPKSSFCTTLLGDVYQWGEVNKEMEKPQTKPYLHFSFDNLRQATRSRIIGNIVDIDQRVMLSTKKVEAVKSQVDGRKCALEDIYDLLRQVGKKEDDDNDTEEALPEHEAANEVHEMVLSIERELSDAKKIIDQCSNTILNMEKQLEHNREQLVHMETQCASLGDSADAIQVKMVEATATDARKLEEDLNYIKEFLDANENARMTLLDQKTEIVKEKQLQHEIVADKRKFEKSRLARLKIIADLRKDVHGQKKASNRALQIAAECLEQFRQSPIHYNSTYSSFHQMWTELAQAKNDLRKLRDTYMPQIAAATQDETVASLLEDLLDLRAQQHRLIEERWTPQDLDLSPFFAGSAKPQVSEFLEPSLSLS